MNHRFPLPYASLCSCYYGLTGKSCDWLSLSKKKWLFKNSTHFDMGTWIWEIDQVGLVMPYHSPYSSDEMNRLYIHTNALIKNRDKSPVLYTEKMEIEEVMYRGNYKNNEKIYHVYIHCEKGEKTEQQKKTTLLDQSYKWKTGQDVHHIIL